MKAFLQRAVLATVMLLATIMARAYQFEVDGIYYDKISDTEVEVARGENSYAGYVTIPENVIYAGNIFKVTSIGFYAFGNCWDLESVNIPHSVTSIGNTAFESCGNLKSVEIPNSITHIGFCAFRNCYSLVTIEIPNSVSSIDFGAFAGCHKLSNILVDVGNPFFCSVEGVLFDKDKIGLIQFPAGLKGSYIIPETVGWINGYAFYDCPFLTSIEFPNSVTSIGPYAFSYCCELTSIELPNCLRSINYFAFSKCLELKYIDIPESVVNIGERAFEECENLLNIFVDENNKNYCSLDGVLFNKNKTELLQYPAGKKIIKYTIPDSVISVYDYAFAWNSALESLIIGKQINSVGWGTFYRCDNLREVMVLNPTPPKAGDWVCLSEIYSTAILYVPMESLEAYKNANGWKSFEKIEPISSSSISDTMAVPVVKIKVGANVITVSGAEGGVCRIFDLRGMEVASRTGLSAHESFAVKNSELYIVQVTTEDGKSTISKVMVK